MSYCCKTHRPSLVPRPSPLSAHYTRRGIIAHADSYARGRPGLKHHVRSVSGTMNRACWGWGARALRRFILVPLLPQVYPTSTSRDVSDQAFHAHNCPHAQNSPAYNERLAGKAWERGYHRPITTHLYTYHIP